MRSSACSVVPSLLLLCFTTSVFAQAPAKQAVVKTPRGSVSGRVTIKDKPAPGVVVGLKGTDNMNPYEQYSKANTDHDGFYRITGVAAGSYNVLAVAPGYVVSDANNSRQVVVIGEDENIDDINFTLVRGAVITGKITDADGKPMIQTQVTVYRTDFADKQRPPSQEATGQTDDRGIYRIFGLMPGKFKVAAGRSDDSPSFVGFGRTYKQVFHPDATDIAKATTIEIGEGGEAKNIDIALGRAVQTFSISGRVITETGSPVPDARFGLQRLVGDRPEFMSTTIVSNLRGDFVAEGLAPGKYRVMQFGNGTSDLRVESSTFDVIDQDVTDLTIRLVSGASISGFMIVESDDKALRSRLPELMVRCFVQSTPNTPSSYASAEVGPDGTFRLPGLQSGTVNFGISGVNSPYPPKGFSIARIERDGVVAPRLEIKDGENVTGVRIVLNYGSGTVRGVITLENGTLPPGAHFFVRLAKPDENNISLRPPTVDARGHFMMKGIPTGVYEVTAQVTGFKGTQPPPVKRTVTVTDGAVVDVAITIDMGGESPENP